MSRAAAKPEPFTKIVEGGPAPTREQLEASIRATMETHDPILKAYADLWYRASHTWAMTHFCGVPMLKAPNDLWAYHEILTAIRPKTIIETGTFRGGSALWFAFLMDVLDIGGGRVYTVDIRNWRDPRAERRHPRIKFILDDSRSPALARELAKQIQYPLLVSLDSDHNEAHVRKELDLYAPLCRVGDYCVVEDTNVSWPGVDAGAYGAVTSYLRDHPGEWTQDLLCERNLQTCHPGGWLQRIAEGRRHGSARPVAVPRVRKAQR